MRRYLLFFLMLALHIHAQQNLLLNPGFENEYDTTQYYGSAQPYFYNLNWAGTPSIVSFSKSMAVYRSGSASQKVVINSIPQNSYCYFAQAVNINDKRQYRASFWVKADNYMKFDFKLRTRLPGYPAVAENTFEISSSEGWKRIEISGTFSCVDAANAGVVDFFINFKTTGTLYLDDAEVTNVSGTERSLAEMLQNPDFEETYGSNSQFPGCSKSYYYNIPSWSTPLPVQYSKDIVNMKTGTVCQKAVVNFSNPAPSYCHFAQHLYLKKKRYLKASVWLKSSSAGSVDFMIRSKRGYIPICQMTVEVGTQWKKYEIIGYTANLLDERDSLNADFLINFKSSGTYYIDNASLKDVTDTDFALPNLLNNSDMEGIYGGDNVTEGFSYNPNWSDPSSATISKNSTDAHSGSACQKIQVNTLQSFFLYQQLFAAKNGQKLYTYVWLRTDSTSPVSFELMVRPESSLTPIVIQPQTVTATQGWVKVELPEVLIPNDGNFNFIVNFTSIGTLYIDDAYVFVTPSPSSPAPVLFSSFESLQPNSDGFTFNTAWGVNEASATTSVDNFYPHSGSSCKKIAIGSIPANSFATISKSFNCLPGRIYRASIWVRSCGPVEIDCTLRSQADGYPWISSGLTKSLSGGEWQKIEFEGSSAYEVSTTTLYFFINFRTSGTLYIDDATVTDITDEVLNLPVSDYDIIPAAYFGMHSNKLLQATTPPSTYWPQGNFGLMRLWDVGAKWGEIKNSSTSLYNFSQLDQYINKCNVEAPDCKLLYTLGNPASWAAVQGTCYRDRYPSCGPGTYDCDVNYCYSVESLTDWENYVTAVVQRYHDKIKYWEIWNEVENFFSTGANNSGETLLDLTVAAYNIIKNIDEGATVLSPNFTGAREASDFLYKVKQSGNPICFDVFSIHKYYDKKPENEIGFWYGFRNMLNNYGFYNVPIWNTEGANIFGTPASDDERAGAVSRAYILQWLYGIKNFNWYYWEPYPATATENWSVTGTLLTSSANNGGAPYTLTAGGQAYNSIATWLTGKRIISKSRNTNGIWLVKFDSGQPRSAEYLVWKESGLPSAYTPPSGMNYYFSYNSPTAQQITNNEIEVSVAPKLLTGVSQLKNVTSQRKSKIQEDTLNASEVIVYPNPVYEILNIEGIDDRAVDVEIYNMVGQLVMKVSNTEIKTGIDIRTLSPGNYVLVINSTKQKGIKFAKI